MTPARKRAEPEVGEHVEPRVRDALVGAAIGLLLIYSATLMSRGILRWLVMALGAIFVLVMTSFIGVTLWSRIEPRLRPIARKARGHTRRDVQLGALTRDVKNGFWEATLIGSGQQVDLVIEGGSEPDPSLLAHARRLAADLESLQRRLANYLDRQAKEAAVEAPEWADEIGALGLASLAFLSSYPAGHVRVAFELTDEERYWTCDYVDGEFSGLDYD